VSWIAEQSCADFLPLAYIYFLVYLARVRIGLVFGIMQVVTVHGVLLFTEIIRTCVTFVDPVLSTLSAKVSIS
jgi:hypothetical protein